MPDITVSDESGIALVRLTKPPANAFDPDLLAEGLRVASELRQAEPDAVVFTGQDRFFSGGLDLNSFPALPVEDQRDMVHRANWLIAFWYGFPRPIVTAINGHAVAGGLILALCGDLRLAVPGASLGLPEVKVGIPYPVAAIGVVKAEVPRKLIRRFVLGGELVEPPEALEAGLVDEVLSADALLERALERARDLASHPRKAYETIKRQLRGSVLDAITATASRDPLADDWMGSDRVPASAAALRRDGP